MTRPALSAALALVCLVPVSVFAQGEEAPSKPSLRDAALETAQAYVDKIKAKQTLAGVKAYWSFEAMCEGIFLDEYAALGAEDQTACAQGMRDLLGPALSDPRVQEAMSAATYSELEASEVVDGKVQISFTVDLNMEGQGPQPQFFWIQEVDGEPKIVDMANGRPEGALTKTLGENYRSSKTPDMTPLDYVRMMAQGR